LDNGWFRSKKYLGDIGIKEDKICDIGRIPNYKAHRVINVDGCIVCPGFIDVHSHSDLKLLSEDIPEAKIRQGVTTEVIGQDGLGVAPVSNDNIELLGGGSH